MVLAVWRSGSVVRRIKLINEVTLRRARLVVGWVAVCGLVYHSVCNHAVNYVNSALHLSIFVKLSTSLGWLDAGNVTSAGW